MDLYLETSRSARLVDDVAAIVQPLVEKNGNTLVVTAPTTSGTMHADQTKVRQALFNLLSNAEQVHRPRHDHAERDERQEPGVGARSGTAARPPRPSTLLAVTFAVRTPGSG